MHLPARTAAAAGGGRQGEPGAALVFTHALCPVNEAGRRQGRGCAPGVTEGPRRRDTRDSTGVFVTEVTHGRTTAHRRGALTRSRTRVSSSAADSGAGRWMPCTLTALRSSPSTTYLTCRSPRRDRWVSRLSRSGGTVEGERAAGRPDGDLGDTARLQPLPVDEPEAVLHGQFPAHGAVVQDPAHLRV